jgi:integrase
VSIYKRGDVYWFTFVFEGKRIQKSTKQANRKAAIDIESAHRTALAKGEVGIAKPKRERRTIGDLLDALKSKYEEDGKLSSQNRSLLASTHRDFGTKMASDFSAEDIEKYVQRRKADGCANATVNRVLEALRRSYKIAKPKIAAPDFVKLSEDGNERKGFFTATEMELVLANLPDDGLRDFVRFGHITGMRLGEIRSLRWENVQDGEIDLAAEDAKTGRSRSIPIESELVDLMKRRENARSVKTSSGITLAEYIFHRGDGQPVGEFRKSWKAACVAVGVGKMVCSRCNQAECKHPRKYVGRIFHDLRRSAIRDLVRAGVPQKVVMEISGHRTISVFNRYNITDNSDMRAALRATQRYRQEQQKAVVSINQ